MTTRRPVPGKDAQWLAWCDPCADMALYASRGGLRLGGTEHCYQCGAERPTRGMRAADIRDLIASSRSHWQKYQCIPYDWNELSEKDRWSLLGRK